MNASDPAGRVSLGACAGLSRRLGIDPRWLRLSFVLLTLAFPTASLLLPEKGFDLTLRIPPETLVGPALYGALAVIVSWRTEARPWRRGGSLLLLTLFTGFLALICAQNVPLVRLSWNERTINQVRFTGGRTLRVAGYGTADGLSVRVVRDRGENPLDLNAPLEEESIFPEPSPKRLALAHLAAFGFGIPLILAAWRGSRRWLRTGFAALALPWLAAAAAWLLLL